MYGYYEWIEIREALKSKKYTYKKAAIEILDKFIPKVSPLTKLPPLIKKTVDKPPPQKKRPSGTWTPNFIPPAPEG